MSQFLNLAIQKAIHGDHFEVLALMLSEEAALDPSLEVGPVCARPAAANVTANKPLWRRLHSASCPHRFARTSSLRAPSRASRRPSETPSPYLAPAVGAPQSFSKDLVNAPGHIPAQIVQRLIACGARVPGKSAVRPVRLLVQIRAGLPQTNPSCSATR